MNDDPTRFPAPRAGAQDDADVATPAPQLLLDIVRRLRARERGYLAGLLHDGPIQELAAVPLELAEAHRAMETSPGDELEVVAQQVDAVGRLLRDLQEELWPFRRSASGLAATLKRRTAWLLATPLAVDVGAGAIGLREAEIQVVADIAELILVDLVSTETRALAEVRAGEHLIFLQVNMTLAPLGDPSSSGPAAARASLRSLAAAIQAGIDIELHGRRLRVRMEIPRRQHHRSGLDAARLPLGPGGAADAGHRGWAGRQPFLPDRLPAPFAYPVPAGFQPLQRRVDRGQLLPRRVKQRGGVLPFEGQRGSFGVVLVVGPGRARRLGEVGELPFQCRDPLPGPRPLHPQQLRLGQLVRGRHISDLSRLRFDLRCGSGCRIRRWPTTFPGFCAEFVLHRTIRP
jgi:hypothetical protein